MSWPLYSTVVFNLYAFTCIFLQVFLFPPFCADRTNGRRLKGLKPKYQRTRHRTKIVAMFFVTLTIPPYRIPCGANCVCTAHDYMLAVLSICKQIRATQWALSRTLLVVQTFSFLFRRSGIKLCLIDNACSNWSRLARVAKASVVNFPSLTVCANRDPHGTNFVGASWDLSLRIQSILFAKFAYSWTETGFHSIFDSAVILKHYSCWWKTADI